MRVERPCTKGCRGRCAHQRLAELGLAIGVLALTWALASCGGGGGLPGNTAPIASFTVAPSAGSPSTVFQFDASACSDAEDAAEALEVRWDWENDGNYDTGWSVVKTATHQYSAAGGKTITLQVRDSGGLADTASQSVTVTSGVPGQIAFMRGPWGGPTICVINSDGTGETDLTPFDWSHREPAWSPDGSRIAYSSERQPSGATMEIYLMDADGSGQVRLTENNSTSDYSPAWSPDGTRVSFWRYFQLWVASADGSGEAALSGGMGVGAGPQAWSPDGAKIAFASGNDLYVVNADGSGRTNLTQTGVGAYSPAWSPDGSKILFVGGLAAYDVYVMNSDGSGQANLTAEAVGNDWFACWSPDGTKIAFASWRDFNYEIYVMNADGSGQTNLTQNEAGDTRPAWSPDGSMIAFESHRDGNWEIYVMNADGSEQTRLTQNPADDWCAGWRPQEP